MTQAKKINVKVSSDDAGAISMSRVQLREFSITELVELIVSVVGKDTDRIASILERGTFTKGLSRLRWVGFTPGQDLTLCMSGIPGDDPERPFVWDAVQELVIEQGVRSISIDSGLAAKRRFLRGRSFRNALATLMIDNQPHYERYDFDSQADRYRLALSGEMNAALNQAAGFLPGKGLRQAIWSHPVSAIVFYQRR